MAERVIISWSFTNWITIVLMAAIGFAAIMLLTQAGHKILGTGKKSQGNPASQMVS